jgi:SAM-dependent methyltransferase
VGTTRRSHRELSKEIALVLKEIEEAMDRAWCELTGPVRPDRDKLAIAAARPRALRIRPRLAAWLSPGRKHHFLSTLPAGFSLLDVGCGLNSPYMVKSLFPDCVYTGIDIGDYRQTKPNLADRYVLVDPDKFADAIAASGKFDAVVSSHNLEHRNDRAATLEAMEGAVVQGGMMYLSFPCEASVRFPSRKGCLNYYDDPTHVDTPPDFDWVVATLQANGFRIMDSTRRYRPPLWWVIGALAEGWSKRHGRLRGTWEYYGFESIIWAEKR